MSAAGAKGAGRKPSAAAGGMGGGARSLSRSALEQLLAGTAPLPRVIALVGGDPLLASEMAERIASRASEGGLGAGGFNRETLYAHEIKLRDLASRVEELPLLAGERVLVVKIAEALLKQDPGDLARTWPRPDASTVLVLVAADEEPRGGRKGPPQWAEVLPAHAVRVAVGTPTREDAVRWGREAATAAGVDVPEAAWMAAHRRARGDGARLRTDLELAVLARLCGRPPVEESGAAPDADLEQAGEKLRELLLAGDWRDVWPAAGRYRSQGGSMDARGAEWVRWVAERLQHAEGSPRTVAALRALSTLQLRWRREIGTARQVLERSALELTVSRLGRSGREDRR